MDRGISHGRSGCIHGFDNQMVERMEGSGDGERLQAAQLPAAAGSRRHPGCLAEAEVVHRLVEMSSSSRSGIHASARSDQITRIY